MVWCFDKAHVIDLGMHTKCGDQADVRAFRCFNSTQAAIVTVMHVTHLKACTLTAKASRTKCRYTALVGNLRQWVRLIEELR